MPLILPTPTQASSEFTVTLGGKTYTLIYTFNERDQRWRLSLYTNDEPIIEGIKIVENQSFLARYRLEGFDHGDLVCVRNKQTTTPVNRHNLGLDKDYVLLYYTYQEAQELINGAEV